MRTGPEIDNASLLAQLQNEFKLRCQKNKAYSLRAFSNYLKIDQSNLTKIMNGQRAFSKKAALQVCEKLGLKNSIVDGKPKKYSSDANYINISEEEFAVLSDWRHLAICEALKIPGVGSSSQKIADHLGLKVEVVQETLESLQSMGLIRKDRRKWSVNAKGYNWNDNSRTTEVRKLLQKSLLEKSIQALEQVAFEYRDHGSLTIALNKSRMPEFKEKMRQLRQDLADFFNDGTATPDEVYQLTLSLFPLSEREIGK